LNEAQRRLIDRLASEIKPTPPAPSPLRQWLVWLVFALAVAGTTLSLIGPQFEIWDRLSEPAPLGFLSLAFLVSAYAAWMGIASSLPDDQPQAWPKLLAAGLVLFLFAMPFLFFGRDTLADVWRLNDEDGWFCLRTVVLVALPSWAQLGWMASRNASFHPGWTGAWLGLSAFALGAGTVQLHCAHWETCHMVIDHLLPMLVLIFIPIWVGAYWFSRWKK
jgi:hypothetical protein